MLSEFKKNQKYLVNPIEKKFYEIEIEKVYGIIPESIDIWYQSDSELFGFEVTCLEDVTVPDNIRDWNNGFIPVAFLYDGSFESDVVFYSILTEV